MACLISKPIFLITPKKIIIQLFYYLLIPNLFKFKIRNKNKYKKISKILRTVSKEKYLTSNTKIRDKLNMTTIKVIILENTKKFYTDPIKHHFACENVGK